MIPDLIPLSDGRQGIRATVEVKTTVSEGDHPTLEFVASSATLDRYREIIEPAGWRLENYRRNPVVLNSHNYGDIIYTLGKAVITEVRAGALYQKIEFATAVNPLARVAYGLYRGGFLNAVSVGFIPVRWENGAPESDFRRKYLEQELLEVSAVSIPANPDALQLAVKSGAVGKFDLEETLDLLSTISRAAAPHADPGSQTSDLTFQIHFLRQLQRAMHNA